MSLEQDKAFEEKLRNVRPVSPADKVVRRIDASLTSIQHRHRLSRLVAFAAWGGMGVAASLLIVFGVLLFNGRLGKSPGVDPVPLELEEPPMQEQLVVQDEGQRDSFRPVLAENNLRNRVDEGIVFLRNGLTARRYRYEFVDRVVWKNPASGAVMEMEIPRDEVVLIPVQTF